MDARALDIRDRMLDIRDRMLDYLLYASSVGVEVVDGGRFREHTPHMHAHTHTSGGGGLAHTEFTAGGGLYAKSPAKRRTIFRGEMYIPVIKWGNSTESSFIDSVDKPQGNMV